MIYTIGASLSQVAFMLLDIGLGSGLYVSRIPPYILFTNY